MNSTPKEQDFTPPEDYFVVLDDAKSELAEASHKQRLANMDALLAAADREATEQLRRELETLKITETQRITDEVRQVSDIAILAIAHAATGLAGRWGGVWIFPAMCKEDVDILRPFFPTLKPALEAVRERMLKTQGEAETFMTSLRDQVEEKIKNYKALHPVFVKPIDEAERSLDGEKFAPYLQIVETAYKEGKALREEETSEE